MGHPLRGGSDAHQEGGRGRRGGRGGVRRREPAPLGGPAPRERLLRPQGVRHRRGRALPLRERPVARPEPADPDPATTTSREDLNSPRPPPPPFAFLKIFFPEKKKKKKKKKKV